MTCSNFIPERRTLRHAIVDLKSSDYYRNLPLELRTAFAKIESWLSGREASFRLEDITASFARMLRDKAARERGWKFGNHALVLVQLIINAEVDAGTLSKNRVRQVPKLLPPRQQPTSHRRRIEPIRRRLADIPGRDKAEKSDEREF